MCVWVEDADKLQVDSSELEIVYINRKVKEFLNSRDCLGIAGTKGQGKTFLLKVKRKKAESQYIPCFPLNIPVDTVDSALHIDDSLYKLLADYSSWVSLWKVAICIPMIKYVANTFYDELLFVPEGLNANTQSLFSIKNKHYQPSVILTAILGMNIANVLLILKDTSLLLSTLASINKSLFVFIDKIDQGFSRYAQNFNSDSIMPKRSRNASIWQYAQFSLAEAAYDIFALGTHHIKIFFSIRHEALIDIEKLNKDKARNILAYISILEYSKNDLEEMYNLYIKNEHDSNLIYKEYKLEEPSLAFLGIQHIDHGYVANQKEKVFDYIYRHTLKRPYDIMKICRALFMKGKEISVQDIRHVINHEGTTLLEMYIHELSNFIPFDVNELMSISELLITNIISIKYMKEACAILNRRLTSGWTCNNFCQRCSNIQPFSILYNLGLIGAPQRHEADTTQIQRFMNIGSCILGLNEHNLPESDFYFIHPSLSNLARDKRYRIGMPFWSNREVIVGDGYPFSPQNKGALLKSIRKSIDQLKREKVFISSTIRDLSNIRDAVQQVLNDRGFSTIMSEKSDFDVTNAQSAHSHDHCIDELLKCKSIVFLIGENYGGLYTGTKYEKECEEIKELASSAGKTLTPSISLMEYYVSRKNKLTCYAFISKDLESRIKIKDPTINEDIIVEYNLLNHLSMNGTARIQGNWISPYSDIDDLVDRVLKLKFFTRMK